MVVYFHRNPVTYGIFYVGVGEKKARAYDFYRRTPTWRDYVSQCGKPVVQIVHETQYRLAAFQWERFYVSLLGKARDGGQLVNIANGGADVNGDPAIRQHMINRVREYNTAHPEKGDRHAERMRAFWRDPEFRSWWIAKRKELLKNNPELNPMKNPEARAKISAINTGKKHSEATKSKLRDARKNQPDPRLGKHHTPETKEKISKIRQGVPTGRAPMKGKRNPAKHTPVSMIDLKTSQVIQVFDCIYDALRHLGAPLDSGNITSVCKGRRTHAYGYKWEYAQTARVND